MTLRPMLAAPTTLDAIQFPCYVSPKLDGIRGVLWEGKALTRSLKEIPNKHVAAKYGKTEHHGLDGEFIVGSPTAPDSYRTTNSALMTRTGTPDPVFYVFDWPQPASHTSRFVHYWDTAFLLCATIASRAA